MKISKKPQDSKQHYIDYCLSAGIYKHADGRQLYELTTRELKEISKLKQTAAVKG
ncbi:Fur-regulated basic protein FbpA [Bacillus marinisedimentorum]|uniref:Fur-regulated basic protein FbpA n=1 Tax=Bacillus marinisedimentorum TaxID=1821260 RepID=UPI0009F59632